MTFGNRKFTRFLAASTVVIAAEYVLVLSDSIIAGRVLGETALGAVNLLMPLFSCVSFFTWLLAVGTSIVCSDAIGRLQRDRAAHLAGQGLVAACLMGLVLALALSLGLEPYFAFMSPDAATRALALSYGRWYPLVAALESVDMLVLYLVYAHGGRRECIVSYVAQTLVNVALSYALCEGLFGLPALGMAGISIGTAAAYATGLVLLAPAVLTRRYGLRFSPRFLPGDFLLSLRASLGDASAGLFHALLFLVVDKYCIGHYGTESLPVVAVVFCIVRLTVFFNGVGIALQPLETVYHGEGNELAVRRLVRFASVVSLAEGVLLTGLVLIAPEILVSVMGIDDPACAREAVHAVRLTVVGLAGYAITYLLNSHYQYVGCPNRSVLLTALSFLGVPALLMFAFGFFFGMTGVFLAVAVGPLVALAAFLPFFRRKVATAGIHMWSAFLDDRTACEDVVSDVARALKADGVPQGGRRMADVLLLSFRRLEKANASLARRVAVEVSLLFGAETVQLVIRDDGADVALDDLGLPVVHLPAAGFNRNVFMQPLASGNGRLRRARTPVSPRYDVLHGQDASTADIEAIVALDRGMFDARYQVSPEQDRDLFLANRESGLIIRERATGEVVGYSMILPIREDVYRRIRAGQFIDTQLTRDMIAPFDHPGDDYRIYFAAIAIHPKHRSPTLLLMMVDAMVEDFIALAERGIYGRTLTADVVSREGEKLAQLLGLVEVCATDHGSRIFEVTALPPELRETTPSTERLVALYWEHFVRGRIGGHRAS